MQLQSLIKSARRTLVSVTRDRWEFNFSITTPSDSGIIRGASPLHHLSPRLAFCISNFNFAIAQTFLQITFPSHILSIQFELSVHEKHYLAMKHSLFFFSHTSYGFKESHHLSFHLSDVQMKTTFRTRSIQFNILFPV